MNILCDRHLPFPPVSLSFSSETGSRNRLRPIIGPVPEKGDCLFEICRFSGRRPLGRFHLLPKGPANSLIQLFSQHSETWSPDLSGWLTFYGSGELPAVPILSEQIELNLKGKFQKITKCRKPTRKNRCELIICMRKFFEKQNWERLKTVPQAPSILSAQP